MLDASEKALPVQVLFGDYLLITLNPLYLHPRVLIMQVN